MKNIRTYEQTYELDPEHQKAINRARKLEWITVVYLSSVVVVMYFAMGTSQAMKTAWLEDLLSLIPSISFLIATRYYNKSHSRRFPYGYHRVFSISFLAGSVALFGMGIFLVIDSVLTLIHTEHPTIGQISVAGKPVWLGWAMFLALAYSAIPAVILGYKKLPLSKKLHNKILHTDADAQKADYLTAFAAMVGVTLVGFGLWWADAVAAIIISASVLKDGYRNLKAAVLDLMDRRPVQVHDQKEDGLIKEIWREVTSWDWIEDATVRFREHGQVYFGEIAVIPRSTENIIRHIEEGTEAIRKMDWKIFDVVITPVRELPDWEG